MKKTRLATVGLLALAMAAVVAPSASADEVYVKDPALNTCVNAAVEAAGDVASVTAISCRNAGVVSLTGLNQFAGTVTSIDLSGNKINDFRPLNGFRSAGVATTVQLTDQVITLPPALVGVHQTLLVVGSTYLPTLLPTMTATVDKPDIVTLDDNYTGWTFTAPGTATLTVDSGEATFDDLTVSYSGTITQTATYAAPSITAQPENQSVTAVGGTATFSVTATPGNPDYTATWQYFDDEDKTWAPIPNEPSIFTRGVEGNVFTLGVKTSWILDGLQVRLVVGTAQGTATSDSATLTIAAKPELVDGVDDTAVDEGGDVTLSATFNSSVAKEPEGLWEASEDGGVTWEPLSLDADEAKADEAPVADDLDGMYVAKLTITGVPAELDGLMFRVTATNDYGATTSDVGTLTVREAVIDEPTPTVTPTAISKKLPVTGSSPLPLIGIGAGLVLVGGAVVTVIALRRRSA